MKVSMIETSAFLGFVLFLTLSFWCPPATLAQVRTNRPKLFNTFGSSDWTPRQVRDDEVTDKRGELEDRLRKAVLSAFYDPADVLRRTSSSEQQRFVDLDELRRVLNNPWNESAVEYLAGILLRDEHAYVIRWPQWQAISSLLAHVAIIHADSPLAAKTEEAFDKLFDRAFAVDKTAKAALWNVLLTAVGEYGSSELLTDSFWQAFEQGAGGGLMPAHLGTPGLVDRLKQMRLRVVWSSALHKRNLDETVYMMEMLVRYPELKSIICHKRMLFAKRIQSIERAAARHVDKAGHGGGNPFREAATREEGSSELRELLDCIGRRQEPNGVRP